MTQPSTSGYQLDPEPRSTSRASLRPGLYTHRSNSSRQQRTTLQSSSNDNAGDKARKRTSTASLPLQGYSSRQDDGAAAASRPASRRVPPFDFSTDASTSTNPTSTRSHFVGQPGKRSFLVPRSALRTNDCFGLDFSFLDEEPPVRSSYAGTFGNPNIRRGSVEQSRLRRPNSVSSDITSRSSRYGDVAAQRRQSSHKAPSIRTVNSTTALPFPSRPKTNRTISSDSLPHSSLATTNSSLPSHIPLASPPVVSDLRRPSTVSSVSFTSTASSSTSGLFSGTRSRNLSSDLDQEGVAEVKKLGTAALNDQGPEALEKRKRLVEFLDQTAEAMEGGRSLAMVLPESKATESEPAKTMSQLAEAAPPRTPAPIEYRHPFATTPMIVGSRDENARSPRDHGLVGLVRSDESAHASSPATPRADQQHRPKASSDDPRLSVYFTPDPESDDEEQAQVKVATNNGADAGPGGLGFKFDIKTQTTLGEPILALTAPDRSPSTVRAGSPSSWAPPPSELQTPSPPPKNVLDPVTLSPAPAISAEAAQEMERRAKSADKRKRTIRELIETEATYASDMVVVREIYLARAKGADIGSIADRVMSSGLGLSRSAAASPPSPLPTRPGSSLSHGPHSSASSIKALDLRRATLIDPRRKSMTPSFQAKLEQRRATLALKEPSVVLGEPIMSPKDLHVVFANLEEVSRFAESFAQVLDEAKGSDDLDEMDDHIGQVFREMIPRIEKIYSTYCSRHDRAINRLQELEPELRTYLTDCRALSSGRTQAWDLGSLLIKPVQRALKYPLLLDQILSLTPEDHPDRHDLLRANELILGVAEHINEQKKRYRPLDNVRKDLKKELNSRRESTRSLSSAVTKKFLRASISKPKPRPTSEQSERDDMFDTLAHLVDSTRSSVLRFSNEMRDWSRATKAQLESQVTLVDGWIEMYAPMEGEDESPLYQRLTIFLEEVLDPIIDGPWRELDHEIRKSLLLKTDHLLSLFESPRQFIAKRNDKMLEHSRYLAKKMPSDRRGSEDYVDLSNKLLEELPRFLNSVSRYYDIIAGHFAGAQEAYQEAVQERWQVFADEYMPSTKRAESTAGQHQAAVDMMHRLAAGLGVVVNHSIGPSQGGRRRNSRPSINGGGDSSDSPRRSSLVAPGSIRRASVFSNKGRPATHRASMTTNRSSVMSDSSTPSFTVSSNSGASSVGVPSTPPSLAGSTVLRPSPKGLAAGHRMSTPAGGAPARFDHPLPQLPIQEVNSSESDASNPHSPRSAPTAVNGYESSDWDKPALSPLSKATSGSNPAAADSRRPPLGRNNFTDGSNSSLSDGRYLARYTDYLDAAGDKFDFSDDFHDDNDDLEEEFEHYERLYTAQAMRSSSSAVSPGFRSGFPIHAFQVGDRIDIVLEEADHAEGGAGWLLGRKCDDGMLGWVRTEDFHLEEEDEEAVEYF
ncbi:hypothetical protein OIO90_001726 [Microbotryomycetes sp. JL221]|nr:hypothetical protein OIO90_001726 [Microbotryomycetes sp. JL221]